MAKNKNSSYSNNPNSQNNATLYKGIKLLKEQNYSTSNTDLPQWTDEGLPLKPGDTFPTADMQRRANINRTMEGLVSGDLEESLQNFIFTWPDLDPTVNKRIATIVASLPLFGIVPDTWELLLHSCLLGVRVNGVDRPDVWHVIDKQLKTLITKKFTSCDKLTGIFLNDNVPDLKFYTDKNIMLSRSDKDEVIYSLTNIYTPDQKNGQQYLEVVSWLPDKTVVRDVFKYANGKVGDRVQDTELVETKAAVHFERNGAGSSTYGQPLLGGCIPASLGTIRAFSTLALLIEKKREVIRIVPDSQIQQDQYTGISAYVGGGTVAYQDNNAELAAHNHDVQFAVPELNMKEAMDTLEAMLKQLSVASGLSGVILGYQAISGNLAAQAIKQSSASTIIRAEGYLRDIKTELKHTIKEMLRIIGEEVHTTDIEILSVKPSAYIDELMGANIEQ